MITCILVGGNSQRFKDAGYETHKAVLPTQGERTILHEVVSNLPDHIVLISGRFPNAVEINKVIKDIRFVPFWFSWSHSVARGPIYGILDASEYLDVDEPVIVSYCDCWIKGGIDELVKIWSKYESGAIGFKSNDRRFGYWHNRINEVIDWEEKWIMNNPDALALSGIFYFNSGRRLVETAFEIARPNKGIVHLLDDLTKIIEVDSSKIVDVGTPEDYEAYLKSNQ